MDRFVAEGLIRIRNGPEFEAFRKWLAGRSEKARSDCTSMSGDMLYRAQGRAQENQEILDAIEASPRILEKLREASSRP
jgi:hypothetical protein